jgi:hypothetical protein
MPYVLRDQAGNIKAVSREAMDSPGWESVDGKSPEYLHYLENSLKDQNAFRESDIQLARVLEDLILLLIERDVIHFTDFPDAAQKRLIERQSWRTQGKGLDLLVDDEKPVI